MKRHLGEHAPRPTAGCLPVPLFTQKRRSRLPLTSTPSEGEFCPTNEHLTAEAFDSASFSSGSSGNSPNYTMSAGQPSPWSRQGYPSSRPVATPVGRGYAPLPHPIKNGNLGPQMGQQRTTARQASCPDSGGHQPAYRPSPPSSVQSQRSELAKTTPPHPGGQWQSSPWTFKAVAHGSQCEEDTPNVGPTHPGTRPQKPAASGTNPAADGSLRILTTVVGGMKHWSQYKDRAPILFELFATLDSAVTAGCHGAKNFLLRDGQDSVRCVFYETDQDLPRLIRGQLHRCVGTYDRGRGLLTCMSVRPASSSEQRNTQESVRASDAEMRGLIKTFREI